MQISVDGVPSPHKTKKAGRRRISAPPASRFSLDSKAFPLAKLKSPQSIVSSTEDFRGGGEGSRTPVRKHVHRNLSERRRPVTFPYSAAGRQTAELGRVMIHGTVNSFRTHVHH